MSDLALFGGEPAVAGPLPRYRSMGEAERAAALEVIDSDCLSGFYGSPGPEFFGGPKVQALERAWCERFEVPFAVSVNSATSGLIAAMGAIGVGPGDEVIVPPYTMSATAMAPLFYGGIPVFADIEPDTFCLDPGAVEEALSPATKAIIAVNLFGHPAQLRRLKAIAEAAGVRLIEDNAQAPLASEDERMCGTVGDIGIASLNFHKHIHSGEGGVCVTHDETLARRLQLIRNHAENTVDWLEISDLTNMIGHNFRMTEISAAIALVQLANVDDHVGRREHLAERLTSGTGNLEGLTPPRVRDGCRHNYYCWATRVDSRALGVSRSTLSRALAAEGFPHAEGYIRPLYLLPLFQRRIAIGARGFPFNLSTRTYPKGLCPVAERMHESEVVMFEPCAYAIDEATTDALIESVHKVHRARAELVAWDQNEPQARGGAG